MNATRFFVFVLSVAVHGAAWGLLSGATHESAARAERFSEVEVLPVPVDPEPKLAIPEPTRLEPQTPKPKAIPEPARSETRRPSAPSTQTLATGSSAPERESAPRSFDDVVLTNRDAPASWSVRAAGGPRTNQRGVSSSVARGARGQSSGTAVVAVADLSRKPKQPNALSTIPRRYFPRDAQRQGKDGLARVRVRIFRDGAVRVLSVLSQTGSGYAMACKRFLQDSPRWSPGVDRSGRAVTTDIVFPCRFMIR